MDRVKSQAALVYYDVGNSHTPRLRGGEGNPLARQAADLPGVCESGNDVAVERYRAGHAEEFAIHPRLDVTAGFPTQRSELSDSIKQQPGGDPAFARYDHAGDIVLFPEKIDAATLAEHADRSCHAVSENAAWRDNRDREIGRASCRERVE